MSHLLFSNRWQDESGYPRNPGNNCADIRVPSTVDRLNWSRVEVLELWDMWLLRIAVLKWAFKLKRPFLLWQNLSTLSSDLISLCCIRQNKLPIFVISGSALALCAFYLMANSFQVTWKGSWVIPTAWQHAVLQGSILDPLLLALHSHTASPINMQMTPSYSCSSPILTVNLNMVELVFLQRKGSPHGDLSITIDNTMLVPT